MNKAQRMRVLEQLEKGEISPDEAADQLGKLEAVPRPEGMQTGGPQKPMDVLAALDRGEISADEAATRLQASGAKANVQSRTRVSYEQKSGETRASASPKDEPNFGGFRHWWLLPLFAGLIVTAASGLWMQEILTERGMGLLFLCSWAPLGIGLALLILGWASRNGTWVHVRVRNPHGGGPRLIAISLPLPLGLASWSIRTFGPHIDALDGTAIDEILTALDQTARKGEPLYVKVHDDGDGEQVEVFIG
jgi:hypothetical protein